MLNKIIEYSIKNKLIIGLLIIALVGYGVYQVTLLPIDAVPDITNNQVQVITVAPALGVTDVERLITIPIEQANSNIPHLKELRSYSTFGLSVITIVLEDDVDIYWARHQIAERLQNIQNEIPKGFGTPFLGPVTTGLGEIYQYVVRPKKGYENKYNAMELRSIQDWIIRKQLMGVKGVADVSSFGGLLKQYEIAIEPEKLLAFDLTISDVFMALEKNNQNTGGSYIEKGTTALFIRSEGLVGNINDIGNILVKRISNGTPIYINDVAEVHLGNATRYGALTYNGELQVSGAVVLMLKGSNSNDVVKNVKQRIEKIKKTLPEGIEIEPFIDRTKMVQHAISTVTQNLMEGALIVIFVLVLFLGNIRAGLIVASVIPLSMLIAIIFMNAFGVSGNLMSLGALDFGLIVDGAVIIVEAVMHRLWNSKHLSTIKILSQQEMDKNVNYAASKMMNSAVFGQIIILIVYLPIFTLQGIEGKMFKPMAQTVAFALIGAFVLSLTYIPMMSSLFLNKTISNKKSFSDKIMHTVEHFYKIFLLRILRYHKTVLISVILIFITSLLILTNLGGEFIPTLPEGDFAVEVRILPSSNLNTSIEVTSRASKILLQKFPEIERIITKTGSSEVPTDPMPLFASDMIIVLKNRNEWTTAKSYDSLEVKMIKALESVAGVSFSFQFPVAMRFNELLSGAKQDVVCKIFGENMDTLSYYANALESICKSVKGCSGLYTEKISGLPQIAIQYNRNAIAHYGLNISDINKIINTSFAGESSGIVYEGEKRFNLVVRLTHEKRKNISDVENLLIPTPDGTQIRLNSVARIEIIEGPNQIQRENSQRKISVGFNVRGRDVQSMVEELQIKVKEGITLPPGYYISYGGAFENLQIAKNRLYFAVPVSLILIFLMLYFAFRSINQSLLIYSAIPLSAIGGIYALAVRGISFSISAGVGFIALFGVAVLNGIVLISEFNRLKSQGISDINRIVLQGTKTRLRPVLMTAFVAALGFVPMAISNGEGAEVQKPLATVVIGGLLVATFLTLFVLPILYIVFHKPKTSAKQHAVLILVGFVFLIQNINAQTPITLEQAIDTALVNNLKIKNERLKREYQKILIKSGTTIPNTYVSGEYGQINSFYVDKRFGISQSIQFPNVYVSQKALLHEEWKSSNLNVDVEEATLKKEVTQLFYTLISLYQKQKLWKHHDSIFSDLINKEHVRFNNGEINILENISTENQLHEIVLHLIQIEQDIEITQIQFQLLLNTNTNVIPNSNSIILPHAPRIDTNMYALHPVIQYWRQQLYLAQASTKLERSKLAPEVTMGYNIMAMRGTGADDVVYNGIPRFQSVQLGLGIPIFSRSQHEKIKASLANETLASNLYDLNKQRFENAHHIAIVQFQKLENSILYYERTALKNAEIISITANQKFLNGDINYFEWAHLLNQAITLQSDYIDIIKHRNHVLAELNFYNNK